MPAFLMIAVTKSQDNLKIDSKHHILSLFLGTVFVVVP